MGWETCESCGICPTLCTIHWVEKYELYFILFSHWALFYKVLYWKNGWRQEEVQCCNEIQTMIVVGEHRLLSGPNPPNVNQSPCRKESQIISVRLYCKNFLSYQMCVIQEKKKRSLNTPRLHLHFSLLSSYYKLLVPPKTSFWSYSNRSTKLKRDSLALYMYIHAHEKNSADYICDHSTCCCCAPPSITL